MDLNVGTEFKQTADLGTVAGGSILLTVLSHIAGDGFGMVSGAAAGAAVVAFVGALSGFRGLRLPAGRWPIVAAVLGAACAGLVAMHAAGGFWSTPEVLPDTSGRVVRLVVLTCLTGLLAATVATDLADYSIPDRLTLPPTVAAIAAAAASGNSQLMHLWVDWTQAVPQIRGPEIPQWIKDHPHLHGLAWSVTGAGVGFALITGTRWVARLVLGRDALGSGDATLMLLVGACVGWQAATTVSLVAPLLCVIGIPLSRMVTGRSFVAYGPYLAAAAVLVLCLWRPLWMGPDMNADAAGEGLRAVFSDPLLFGFGIGLLFIGTPLLLGLLVAFRSLPVRSGATDTPAVVDAADAANTEVERTTP